MEPEKTEIQTGTDDSEKSTPAAAGSGRTPAGSVRSLILELLLRAGGTVLALWLVLTFIAGLYVNHGNEGYPMVKDGDLCVTYRLAGLRPGDAVMYVAPDGRRQCGRVAALAGDRVEISGNTLLVNGFAAPVESFYPTSAEDGVLQSAYTVPSGCVFVVNDCRVDGQDSRIYGGIPLGNCRGKIILVVRRRDI
ncbi:MAG: signal peptidase I [Clostridia bacterium]|nr:signal peptidase I [Clostridia bacterium]